MDPPLPEDFDPNRLIDDPMQQPRKPGNESNQGGSSKQNRADDIEGPMHFLPASLKRLIVTGSCCTSVAVLYVFSSWDHGWIPGLESTFARANDLEHLEREHAALKSDLAELYILSIARAIRDLQSDICVAPSMAKAEQLEALQYKYQARTGGRYPHTVCLSHTSERRY